MLFFTGISRQANTILKEQTANIKDRLATLRQLKAMAYVAREEIANANIDVLGDLQEVPETMLVVVEAQAMLLPEETDVRALDPANTTAPPADTTKLLSNPVRIMRSESASADPGL